MDRVCDPFNNLGGAQEVAVATVYLDCGNNGP